MSTAASTALLRPVQRTQPASFLNREEPVNPEVTQLLRRIGQDREDVQDVTDKTAKASFEVTTAVVLYNPFSLDSMMAAALLSLCTSKFSVNTTAHHFIDTHVNVGKSEVVIAAGMELSSDEMENLLKGNPDLKLVLFSYRDGYQWLQSEKTFLKKGSSGFWDYPLHRKAGEWYTKSTESALYRKYKDRIQIVRPDSDYHGELVMRTDNTLTKMVQFWLAEKEHKLNAEWSLLADLAARISSQTFPLTGFHATSEDAADMVTDAAARVKIFELTVKLRAALASAKPSERLQEMKLEPNQGTYRAHMGAVEQTFSRAVHDTLLPRAGRGGAYSVRVAQATESAINDLVNALPVIGKDIAFYEDLRRYRVWRFYSPKFGRAQELSSCLKPIAVWSEGLFYCALVETNAIAM